MVCDICGATIEVANVYESKYHCSVCYMRVFPPMLILTVPWTSLESLMYPKTKQFEHRTIEQLQQCGLFLFKHRIYNSKNYSPLYREFLTFRYRGRMRCHKIDYGWPTDSKWCMNSTC